jgi:hypothetical protein
MTEKDILTSHRAHRVPGVSLICIYFPKIQINITNKLRSDREKIGSSLFCAGKQLPQVSLTQRIDSPKFLDRINPPLAD